MHMRRCCTALRWLGMSLSGPPPTEFHRASLDERLLTPSPSRLFRCRRQPTERAERRDAGSRSRCTAAQHSRPRHGACKQDEIVNTLGAKRHLVPTRGAGSLAGRATLTIVAAAGMLAVSALVNHQLARRAERRNRPIGRFLDVDG